MERIERLQQWTGSVLPSALVGFEVASADASFRRYFRARTAAASYIVMDAPPSHEDCRPYLHIARLFRAAGANTPEILAENLAEGFLLLSDFGNTTYLAALTCQSAGALAGSLTPTLYPEGHESRGQREQSLSQNRVDDETADRLYLDANAALIRIQSASRPGELPDYDEALLLREMRLFPEWYLGRHLQIELSAEQNALLDSTFRAILDNNLAQAKVYVHRDWHSRNLMVTEPNPGVLDFQDAVYGPISYDLVSIYKDAYIHWEEERVLDWVIRYWEAARKEGLPVPADFADFYRDFEWMGVQRHIKVLGIFARLYHRDGKEGYLKDMPLVMHYLRQACGRYNALAPFLRFLDELEGRQAAVGYTF
ncbi:MAG: phosphotransferase [Hydrogenophilaceae bacterium]|nr:phosphotransferase [Hydrogenophilaceae bacterium]